MKDTKMNNKNLKNSLFSTVNANLKLVLVLFVLFAAVQLSAAQFVIFHSSDIHGAIASRLDATFDGDKKPMIGGFAVAKNVMKTYKNNPESALAKFMYFDSGDMFQGTPIVDRTKGSVMIEMFNRLELNGMTMGNHEFDYTYQNLDKQLKLKDFAVICCNVFDKNTRRLPKFTVPYRVYVHRGIKIGVIGVDTTRTAIISFHENVKDLEFRDPLPLVKPIIRKMRRGGVDFIILLSHLGFAADIQLASQVKGIDLILGGHTHKLSSEITYAEPYNTPIIHSGSSLTNLTVVKLNINKGQKTDINFESVRLDVGKYGEDPVVKALTDEYLHDLNTVMGQVIGHTDVYLSRGVPGGDSPCASIVADAMRDAAGADFGFVNIGGVRQSLSKGDITLETAFLIQPFDNRVVSLKMSGKDLYKLVETAYSNTSGEFSKEEADTAVKELKTEASGIVLRKSSPYGILLPSNLHITYDPTWPPMKRVLQLTNERGEAIDKNKNYTVAFNDYVAMGGDGYTMLKNCQRMPSQNILVRDALVNYIKKLKQISKRPNRRVYNVKLQEKFLD